MKKCLRPQIISGILVLLLGLGDSPVWSQLNTSRSSSFGDSLTDNASLYVLFGTNTVIYGADPFEAVFKKAANSQDQLSNHAVLGSPSAEVLHQVNIYAAARAAG